MEVRQRGRWPGRRPGLRRCTDRVEDAVAWLLVSLALLTAVLATAVGITGHDAAQARFRDGTADRIAVRAELLEAAEPIRVPDGLSAPPRQVMARWTPPCGAPVSGEVAVEVRRPAGAQVTIWLDRTGRPVPAPAGVASPVLAGWLQGIGVALAGWVGLVLCWLGVRKLTAARNAAAWSRGWERIEPVWSGRVP